MTNLTATIHSLYLAYDAGDVGVCPILADALEDSGNYEEAEQVRERNMHLARTGATTFLVYSKRQWNRQTIYSCVGYFYVFSTHPSAVKQGLRNWMARYGLAVTPTSVRKMTTAQGQGTFPTLTPVVHPSKKNVPV
jgi:hypothetical protein